MKIIGVYVNGKLSFYSVNYRSCKEAVEEIRNNGGYALVGLTVNPGDKITAKVEQ